MPDLLDGDQEGGGEASKDGEKLAEFRALAAESGCLRRAGELANGPRHVGQHRAERHPEDGQVLPWN